MKVLSINELVPSSVDALVLSSATYETDMALQVRAVGVDVYAPYADWLRPLAFPGASVRAVGRGFSSGTRVRKVAGGSR